MRFLGLAPGLSWALLAGVAAAVVLLYLLKPSPRRLLVASSLIWQRVLKERKRKPEHLRWWLSMLLALGIALSIALALTRPELATLSGKAQDIVLVVDNSATMSARLADGRTRLALALERAKQLIAAAGAGSRFMVVDGMRQLGVPAFESRSVALERLGRIAVIGSGRPWVAHLPQPQKGDSSRQIYLISDGVAPIGVPDSTHFVSVFRPADNIGIVAFDVRAAPVDARRYEAFVKVINASPGIKRAELSVIGVGASRITRSVQLEGGAAASLSIDVSRFSEGPIKAVVTTQQDAFALDDEAFSYLPSKAHVRIGVVGTGNAPLMQSLRLLPRLEVRQVSLAHASDPGRFDAIIFDRIAPEKMPSQPALFIAPPARSWLPKTTGELIDTHLAAWDDSHPLLGGVALRDVLLERAQGHAADASPGRFAAVATGPREEAVILATREGRRLALIGFSLDASNFARQPSFPSFLANAVNWLTREPRAQTSPIGAVSVPAHARVLDIAGQELPVRAVPGGGIFDASVPGVFTAVTREARIRLVVNLFDPAVSRINDGRSAAADIAPGTSTRIAIEPWLALLALAALLLGLEWITYNRRVTL